LITAAPSVQFEADPEQRIKAEGKLSVSIDAVDGPLTYAKAIVSDRESVCAESEHSVPAYEGNCGGLDPFRLVDSSGFGCLDDSNEAVEKISRRPELFDPIVRGLDESATLDTIEAWR
jgi:hypothetical protein